MSKKSYYISYIYFFYNFAFFYIKINTCNEVKIDLKLNYKFKKKHVNL